MLGAQAAEHWGSLGIQPHAPEQQEQQQRTERSFSSLPDKLERQSWGVEGFLHSQPPTNKALFRKCHITLSLNVLRKVMVYSSSISRNPESASLSIYCKIFNGIKTSIKPIKGRLIFYPRLKASVSWICNWEM